MSQSTRVAAIRPSPSARTSARIPARLSAPMSARWSGVMFLGLAGFQVALAAGAPWGAAAWGGAHPGTLPIGYRVASATGAVVWLAVAAEVATGAGTARLGPRARRGSLTALLGLMGLSAVMNAASPSPVERAIWTPFAVLQLALLWSARRRSPGHRSVSKYTTTL